MDMLKVLIANNLELYFPHFLVFVPHCNFAILSMQGRVQIWEVIVGAADLVD
jgi:hypothetical protein